jgi:hypothetical protein
MVDGLVFNDANQNGLRDLAEAQIPRRVVFIDADNDGVLDASERRVLSGITPTSNGSGGSYRFAIPAGTVTVRQVLPEKWVQSLPAAGEGHSVTVVAGQATRVQGDFGSYAVPEVVATHVFYKGSVFDVGVGNTSNPNDHAIAPDKTAALPSQPGTFGSVTSYSRGINGIMVDVAHLSTGVRALTADDFGLRVTDSRGGLGSGESSWADAPAPASVTLRRGEGDGGSDRITLTWPDGALKNAWLEVSIRPDGRVGPTDNGRFYFGNLVGETGDPAAAGAPLRVSALDLAAVKRTLDTFSPITGPYDFNRDGRVDALDLGIVKANLNRSLAVSAVPVVVGPAAPPPAPSKSHVLVGRVWDEEGGLLL